MIMLVHFGQFPTSRVTPFRAFTRLVGKRSVPMRRFGAAWAPPRGEETSLQRKFDAAERLMQPDDR